MNNIKFRLTPEASAHLNDAYKKYTYEIQKFVKESKYVPGDRIIEITASDIKEAMERTVIVKPSRKHLYKTVTYTYGILGLAMVFFGLFYDYFKYIYLRNPIQLMITLTGLMFIVAGFVFYFQSMQREKRLEFERRREEIQRKRY